MVSLIKNFHALSFWGRQSIEGSQIIILLSRLSFEQRTIYRSNVKSKAICLKSLLNLNYEIAFESAPSDYSANCELNVAAAVNDIAACGDIDLDWDIIEPLPLFFDKLEKLLLKIRELFTGLFEVLLL